VPGRPVQPGRLAQPERLAWQRPQLAWRLAPRLVSRAAHRRR
jgi:hypothetical protein